MFQPEILTVGLHHLRERAVSKVFPQANICMRALRSTSSGSHPSLAHRNWADKKFTTYQLIINRSKSFKAFRWPFLGEIDGGVAIVHLISHKLII